MAALNDLAYEILMSMIIARTYKHSVFSSSSSLVSNNLTSFGKKNINR
jgi:hypothetical protein